MSTPPVVELAGVVKDYKGLRPLRVEHLAVSAAESVALVGVDQPSAEVLINLVTGTTLPDHGTVRVFGQSTAEIRDSQEWMTVVDRFGILSERAVLLEALSSLQNLAIPFSLDVEPLSPELRARAAALALEVGLPEASWGLRVSDLDQVFRTAIRLGRALALSPEVLLLEHPSALVPTTEVSSLAARVRSVIDTRGIAALTLTADRRFAHELSRRVLMLNPSTGRADEVRPTWFERFRARN